MKKKQTNPDKWFVVFSDYGYFTGLGYGGVPQWSLKENEAKPLNHMNKFHTLRGICPNLELIFENIK